MRRHLRPIILLVGMLGLIAGRLEAEAPAVPAPALPETFFPGLSEILANSARQSSRMVLREAENVIAEGNRAQARAPELPSVSAGLTYYPFDMQSRNHQGTQNVDQLSYNLGVTQPIYHWGALRDAARTGALGAKIARGQTADAYRALIVEIRGQYLQLIIKKNGLARARYAQQRAERNLELAKLQLERHIIADSDTFGPTLTAEQAVLNTDRAVEDFENARTAFAKTSGGPAPTEAQLPDSIPAVTPAPAALQEIYASFTHEAEPNTFGLQILHEQIAIEKLNYAVAAKRLRPTLNGLAGISQNQTSYSQDPGARYQVRDMFVGVQIGWSIFDGFATRAVKANSLARRRQLEQSYRDQTADVLESVRSQYRQLEFSARNLSMAERLYAVALNGYNFQKDNLARGLASQADVDNARLSIYDADIAIYGARADYLMKVADFLSTTLADPALANLPPDLRR